MELAGAKARIQPKRDQNTPLHLKQQLTPLHNRLPCVPTKSIRPLLTEWIPSPLGTDIIDRKHSGDALRLTRLVQYLTMRFSSPDSSPVVTRASYYASTPRSHPSSTIFPLGHSTRRKPRRYVSQMRFQGTDTDLAIDGR